MGATTLDLIAIQSDATAYAGTFRALIGCQASLGYTPANDANVLHTTGNETKVGDLSVQASSFSSYDSIIRTLNASGFPEVELSQGLATGYGGVIKLCDGLSATPTGYARIRYDQGYSKLETTGSWQIMGLNSRVRFTNSYIDMGGTTDATQWMHLDGGTNKSRAALGFHSRNLADSADAPLIGSTVTGGLICSPYTFSTVPSASANAGLTIRITDRSHRLATSDGTNWNWTGTTTAIS